MLGKLVRTFVVNILALALLTVIVGLYAVEYVRVNADASRAVTDGVLVMPLDDAYIHAQYARSIIQGHPYRYNPSQPPTSGATSLIYPYVLAAGAYFYRRDPLQISTWALLIGALSWALAVWAMYVTVIGIMPKGQRLIAWRVVAFSLAVGFAVSGSLAWAFMSGMETGLFIACLLWTLACVVYRRFWLTLLMLSLTVLVRPEGLPIAMLTLLYTFTWRQPWRPRRIFALSVPILCGLIQPALNLLLTGSAAAAGLQAKSYLYNVPFDQAVAVRAILNNLGIGLTNLIGQAPLPALAMGWGVLLALLGAIVAVFRRQVSILWLVLGWIVCIVGLAAVLETAFWHQGRYQQPAVALMFIVLGVGLAWAWQTFRWPVLSFLFASLLLLLLPLTSYLDGRRYLEYYAGNVREVAYSQINMATATRSLLPAGAIVAVHDIGVMRYVGNHTTYDVVGLTTLNAALAWRNGPGSTFEQMLHSPLRPDYFAIYNDARGLTYFQNTGLFHKELAHFPSVYISDQNVASATLNGQFVYQIDWSTALPTDQPQQGSTLAAIKTMTLQDAVNVAYLDSEQEHHYRWWQSTQRAGFPSEVREMDYAACGEQPLMLCRVMDGGRLITGGETMIVHVQPHQPVLWVTRIHPFNAATLQIAVNGKPLTIRYVPAIAGQWIEMITLIPADRVTQADLTVQVTVAATEGHYMPYYHWFYQGEMSEPTVPPLDGPPVTFSDGTHPIQLVGHRLAFSTALRMLTLEANWQTDPLLATSDSYPQIRLQDAKLFIHLYDEQGKLVETAQLDQRLGAGVLPYINWLGGPLYEVYRLPIPSNVAAGTYRVAIGLYEPISAERFTPEGASTAVDTIDSVDRRVFLGTITVP